MKDKVRFQLRNMGMKILVVKRAGSNLIVPMEPYQTIELPVYKESCFFGIDWENQRVVIDVGLPE